MHERDCKFAERTFRKTLAMSSPVAFGANQTYNAERHAGSVGSFGVTSTPERYTSRGGGAGNEIVISSDEEREREREREDDVMSIASAMSNVELAQTIVQMQETTQRAMEQMQANFQRQTEEMTNNFRSMMTNPVRPARATPRANRTTTATNADGTPAPSPQKIAFDNEHAQVVNETDTICKQIQELNIKELWWVQQWVDEAKLRYDMNSRELRSYKDKVWTYGAKQAAGMTIQARNTTRT